VVVVVGGLMASGKTTVARRIATLLCAERVSADETREGLLATTGPGALLPGFSKTLYVEVFRRARAALASAGRVVLDGSFRSRELRVAARELALERGVPFLFVECRAGVGVCRERVRRRERESGHPGWTRMFEAFLDLWEPVEELGPREHVVTDTSGPVEDLDSLDLAALLRGAAIG
jgi:predicted kinase